MGTGESPHTPTRVWEPRSKPGARPGPHTHRGMEYEVRKPCQGSGLLRVSGNLRVPNSLPESSGENRSENSRECKADEPLTYRLGKSS